MDFIQTRIEDTLDAAVERASTPECPPRLATALRYAVFPGGARIRPRLCLAVASACGDPDPRLSNGAACALELLHCASLVHDDMPCFDNASTRRGKLSVHRAHGERLAVLVGDALIVIAFETLGASAGGSPQHLAALLAIVARGTGMPGGIVAGQAWECEQRVSLSRYQQAKTGALFAAATMAGALAAGAAPEPWRALGERLGEAYQVADDIRDVVADPLLLGKPVGRDLALGRPSVAHAEGLEAAIHRFDRLLRDAIDAIPACPGAAHLRALVRLESERLVPKQIADDMVMERVREAA